MLEKHARGRSTFQIISFIGAIHVVALCGLLWIGCKKDDQAGSNAGSGLGGLDPQANPGLPPVDPGLPPIGGSPTALPGISNAPVPTAVGGAGAPTAYPVGGGTAPAGGNVGTATTLPPTTAITPQAGGGGLAPLPPAGGGGLPPVDGSLPPTGGQTTTTGTGEYKVQAGDTGSKIATKSGVKLAALKAANPGVDWNRLKVNQTLVIPPPTTPAPAAGGGAPAGGTATGSSTTGEGTAATGGTTYTVRPGDNGMRIAKKTGVTWKAIRAANGLSSDNIRAGQKLVIPAKGASAVSPTTPPPGGGAVTPTATPLPSLPAGQ